MLLILFSCLAVYKFLVKPDMFPFGCIELHPLFVQILGFGHVVAVLEELVVLKANVGCFILRSLDFILQHFYLSGGLIFLKLHVFKLWLQCAIGLRQLLNPLGYIFVNLDRLSWEISFFPDECINPIVFRPNHSHKLHIFLVFMFDSLLLFFNFFFKVWIFNWV